MLNEKIKLNMKNYLILLIALFAVSAAFAQPEMGDILIKNGTVLTITDGVKENTDVLIQNGKITRVAQNINAPRGVEVIDASGQYVMPGIIDAHSHAGIDAVNEGTNPVTAEVFIGDAVDPFDITLYRALAGGCTSSHAMHGSANVIGGECETIKHRWGTTDPEVMKMEDAPRTIKFALGENPTRVHGEGSNKVPGTRMGVEFVIREAFTKAQNYMAAWDKYNKEKASNPNAVPPKYSRRMETLADILRGEIKIGRAHV